MRAERHLLDHSSSSRDGSGVPHRIGSSAGPVHRGQRASTSSPSLFPFRTSPAYNFSVFLNQLGVLAIGASSKGCTTLWCCWKHSCTCRCKPSRPSSSTSSTSPNVISSWTRTPIKSATTAVPFEFRRQQWRNGRRPSDECLSATLAPNRFDNVGVPFPSKRQWRWSLR